jgi:hypothetical protein
MPVRALAETQLSQLLPLNDTKSELLLLARAYLRINKANRRLARIIEHELGRDAKLRTRTKKANAALLESLAAWLSTKKAAANARAEDLQAAIGLVFGSWLFVLGKQVQQTLPKDFDLDFIWTAGRRSGRRNWTPTALPLACLALRRAARPRGSGDRCRPMNPRRSGPCRY